MVWRAISYNSRSHFVFLQSNVNSARYHAQVVNPVLLLFIQQECDVIFSRTAHVAATQGALRGVQLPWPARSPDLSPIEHVAVWDMMMRELTLSSKLATTFAKLRERVQDAWENLAQDDIRYLYDSLHASIHACVAARGGYT